MDRSGKKVRAAMPCGLPNSTCSAANGTSTFAADNGRNETIACGCWNAEGNDPLGPYRCHGPLKTSGWAIDGTVLTAEDGLMFFLWSGWPGRVNGRQNLYIAPMKSPTSNSPDPVY